MEVKPSRLNPVNKVHFTQAEEKEILKEIEHIVKKGKFYVSVKEIFDAILDKWFFFKLSPCLFLSLFLNENRKLFANGSKPYFS